MESIFRLSVRTYELDENGHVNNAVYLNYFEAARHQFLKDVGFDYKELVNEGYGVFIARAEVDYVRSSWLDDELVIHTWPVKKGAVSGVILQEIYKGEEKDPNQLVAKARMTWALVDAQGKPTRIPAPFDVPGLKPSPEEAK
jgi:acyl-CoA thioester hydrolase